MRRWKQGSKSRLKRRAPAAVEELLLRLLESQEEQGRWLLENREGVNKKIQRGLDQLERGRGFLKTGSMPTWLT